MKWSCPSYLNGKSPYNDEEDLKVSITVTDCLG